MLEIRAATRDDVSRLTEFGRRTFDTTFAPDNTADDMAAYLTAAFNEPRQLAEIDDPNTVTLLAERGALLVGYAQLRTDPPPECVPDRGAIELVRFYVDQAWHGQGIAQALMQRVSDEAARSSKSIWLGVWERNTRAIRFYEKMGFVDVGSHDFMLGTDRQTDRIMWRSSGSLGSRAHLD